MIQKMERDSLEKLKRGDPAAFEKVLLEFEKPIFGYISGMVNQRQTAEDLTQEVFIKLYKNLKKIDLEKSFKSWLYKIATNTVYDWLKADKRRGEIFSIDEEDGFETIDGRQSYQNIESGLSLEQGLAKIKPVYRTVLLLFYYEGFSYQEISSTLSIPLNTVKTYLKRGKEALGEQIKEIK